MDDFLEAVPVARDPRYAVTPSGSVYRIGEYTGQGARKPLPHRMKPLMMGATPEKKSPHVCFGFAGKAWPIGRLVLEAFGEPEPTRWSRVKFLTEDRSNVSIDNVRWAGVDVNPTLRQRKRHAVAVAPRPAAEQPASVISSSDAGA